MEREIYATTGNVSSASAGPAMKESADRIYTVEIGGRAVLTFPAKSLREAQSLIKETWLLDDLRELKSRGARLWDGKEKIVVRNARPDEAVRFERRVKSAEGDDLPIVYLVELY
jgi:hypothetical protein